MTEVATVVGQQITLGAVAVWIVQRLKAYPKFSWISEHTVWVNRTISGFLAICTAAGIHYEFSGVTGILTVTGLTLPTIFHGLWHWLQNFTIQELIYQGVVNTPKRVEVKEALNEVKEEVKQDA